MNFIWIALALSIFASDCMAKKRKIDLDFEFVDKVIKLIEFNSKYSDTSIIRINNKFVRCEHTRFVYIQLNFF